MRERQKEQIRRILKEIRYSANPSPRSGDETSSQLSSPSPSLKIMNDNEVYLKKKPKRKRRKKRILRILKRRR